MGHKDTCRTFQQAAILPHAIQQGERKNRAIGQRRGSGRKKKGLRLCHDIKALVRLDFDGAFGRIDDFCWLVVVKLDGIFGRASRVPVVVRFLARLGSPLDLPRQLNCGLDPLDPVDIPHDALRGDTALRVHEVAQPVHGLRVKLINP